MAAIPSKEADAKVQDGRCDQAAADACTSGFEVVSSRTEIRSQSLQQTVKQSQLVPTLAMSPTGLPCLLKEVTLMACTSMLWMLTAGVIKLETTMAAVSIKAASPAYVLDQPSKHAQAALALPMP